MNGWTIKDLLLIQKRAQEGDIFEVEQLISGYPLAAVSSDYSLLVVLRQFHVNYWKGDRRILNREPGTFKNQSSEDEQWGITLSLYNIATEEGITVNYCIPNYNYTELLCTNDGEIEIKCEEDTVTTNVQEICSKLTKIYGYATHEKIEKSYQALNNENNPESNLPKLVDTIESSQAGILLYDENNECYEGHYYIENTEPRIAIYPYSDNRDEQKEQIAEADTLLENKFYEKALQAMYPSMLKLKNEHWLEDGEKPLSIEEFACQVKIASIVFSEGDTIVIYCNGAFGGGHAIEIYMDNEGNYESASICG